MIIIFIMYTSKVHIIQRLHKIFKRFTMYNISQNNTRSEHYRAHKELMKDKQSDMSKL